MIKINLITIITMSMFYGILQAQKFPPRSIEAINYYLDSVSYDYLISFDYENPVILPDSTKNKVLAVLNGYIPPQKIREVTYISDEVMKRIEKRCKGICKNDSLCFVKAKDSIINKRTTKALFILNNQLFPKNFLLAVGAWGVKDSEPILLKNINNPRYPKEGTLLALAKLGNDSVEKVIMNRYTIQYVINNKEFKTNDPELIYNGNARELVYDFFRAGMYLKSKQILLNMVDLLDIQGKAYFFEDLIPVELKITMWLGPIFMTKENIANGTYKELDLITTIFFNQIDDNYKSTKIKTILSPENKTRVKGLIKEWINKNVEFE